MDIKDGLLGKLPFVTIALALAMTICFATQVLGGVENGGLTEETLLRAQAFFEQNAGLEVNARQRSLLGADFVTEVRAAHDQRGDSPVFSERMRRRTQARFDALCDEALDARMTEDPAWRHGITGTGVPAYRFVTYAFFHAGWLAFGVTLLFLVLAGLGLETTWGPLFFAPVSMLAIVTGALVFSVGDSAGHMPLSGGGPLVAALLGAYVVRGAGGNLPLPGVLLLGVWLFVDALFVRGIWIDNVGDWPWLTLGLSLALGAGLSAGIRFMGVEAKLVDVAETLADGRHPAIAEAERLAVLGRLQDAFGVLAEAAAQKPADGALALALWDAAIEVGRSDEVVHVIVPVLQSELRTGDIELATRHWRQVMATGVPVQVSTTVLVRMGEALLDVGAPEEALESLRRALDAPGTMGSALAQRVVRIARDLDPVLTARAAEVALRDPQIEVATRADLESLAGGGVAPPPRTAPQPREGRAASGASGARPSSGTTAALADLAKIDESGTDEIGGLDDLGDLSSLGDLDADLGEMGIDLSHSGDLSSPDDFAALEAGVGQGHMELGTPGASAAPQPENDPNALSIQSLERELASGLGDDLVGADAGAAAGAASWNDPGLVEDLSDELDSAPPSLIAEADLDVSPAQHDYLDAGALSLDDLSLDPSALDADALSLDADPPRAGAPSIDADGLDPNALGADALSMDASALDRDALALDPNALDTDALSLDPDALDPGALSLDPHALDTGALSLDPHALDTDALAVDAGTRAAAVPPVAARAPAAVAPPVAAPAPAAVASSVAAPATAAFASPPESDVTDPLRPPVRPAPARERESPPTEPLLGARRAQERAAAASSMRSLKVLEATPLALEPDSLKFDVAGRGKTRLPFERIDAVAVAAVAGLSAKPVLVIDFVLNWKAGAGEPLKVIRVRSDGFNPVTLVGGGGTPLESIKTLIRRVLAGAQATPLPDAGAAQGSPFSMQPDLESYQRDVLMAI